MTKITTIGQINDAIDKAADALASIDATAAADLLAAKDAVNAIATNAAFIAGRMGGGGIHVQREERRVIRSIERAVPTDI